MFREKLLTSLQDNITNALSSLKVHVEGEIQALRENFRVLELRITKLEQVDEDDQRVHVLYLLIKMLTRPL